MNLRRRIVLVPIFFGPFVLTGCPAVVHQFVAAPIVACPGTPITVSWQTTSNTTTIDQRPTPFLPHTVDANGSGTFHIDAHDSNMTITATRSSAFGTSVANDSKNVSIFNTSARATPPGMEACSGGNVVWQGAFPTNSLTTHLVPYRVAFGGSRRPLTLMHGGVTEVITSPSVTSTARFGSTTLAGVWTVSVPLIGGDVCPTSGVLRTPLLTTSLPELFATPDASCDGAMHTISGLPNPDPPAPTSLPPSASSEMTCGGHAPAAAAALYSNGVRNTTTHCADVLFFYANSADEAHQCSMDYVTSALGGGAELVTDPEAYYDVACTGTSGCDNLQIPAFSEDDALDCARATTCSGRTVDSGTCP